MKMRRNIVIAMLSVALGTVLVLTQAAWSDRHDQPLKLEGSWIQTWAIGWQTMYTMAPSDPTGQEASFQGSTHVTDPTLGGLFPDAQDVSSYIGQAVVTGPNQARITALQYGLKKVGSSTEKVFIVVVSGTMKRTAPGKSEGNYSLALYLPSQDADGDGLPDKGQAPIMCVPGTTIDTRLPLLPPCTP